MKTIVWAKIKGYGGFVLVYDYDFKKKKQDGNRYHGKKEKRPSYNIRVYTHIMIWKYFYFSKRDGRNEFVVEIT